MLAITVGYGMYYTCRLGLSVVKKPLIDQGIFTIEELGAIGAALFYGYAFGKFFNGFLADHVRPSLFFTAGLCLSALVNLSMGFSTLIALSIALWALKRLVSGLRRAQQYRQSHKLVQQSRTRSVLRYLEWRSLHR